MWGRTDSVFVTFHRNVMSYVFVVLMLDHEWQLKVPTGGACPNYDDLLSLMC